MRLQWTFTAIGDLKAAGELISLHNPDAARRMAERVSEATGYLLDYPHMGRPGRVVNTRELVVSGTPLIVIYRVRGRAVQTLRVLHHSRKLP
ncbi:MAG TPA: type II toxin-antitoxin system RelE/ParE family toxin [Syntrophorhabdales bacterium]|nr:type II toxin-antitoxin system RelE/ParE family toxin [Syntrophorhabdales bacterium]